VVVGWRERRERREGGHTDFLDQVVTYQAVDYLIGVARVSGGTTGNVIPKSFFG
jgi:hypothetical protein